MALKHGFIRLSRRGPSEEDQRAALVGAGVDPDRIHVDDKATRKRGKSPRDARTDAIHAVRKDDVLLVASPGRLGVSREDIRDMVRRVTERGGKVHAVNGEPFGGPELGLLLAFEEAGHREVERERTEPGRRARGTLATRRLTDKQRSVLLPMWHDPEHCTIAAVEMKAEELGANVKRRTLYKLLGVRVPEKE